MALIDSLEPGVRTRMLRDGRTTMARLSAGEIRRIAVATGQNPDLWLIYHAAERSIISGEPAYVTLDDENAVVCSTAAWEAWEDKDRFPLAVATRFDMDHGNEDGVCWLWAYDEYNIGGGKTHGPIP